MILLERVLAECMMLLIMLLSVLLVGGIEIVLIEPEIGEIKTVKLGLSAGKGSIIPFLRHATVVAFDDRFQILLGLTSFKHISESLFRFTIHINSNSIRLLTLLLLNT